jgi:hypothetical protein
LASILYPIGDSKVKSCRRSRGDLSSSGGKSAIDGSWVLGIRGVVVGLGGWAQLVVVWC